ncbi:MAG: exodeoxyribonuclease VII large subunit [Clostridiales bacterium]|nr:exodeoxyribonuclease VII large subunit [Clostridiales bacterium]
MKESVTLLDLNNAIARSITTEPTTQNVWVTTELSDVAVRRGHCYMELLQKDDRGNQIAKARGVIWANRYYELSRKFTEATGQQFKSGIKLMLKVAATMHPVFGLSLVINDLDPDFSMGDLLRRRREIIERLTKEGVINLNRDLQWSSHPQNIAIISAPGAAGYGDFINQLYNNPSRLRFNACLFPAVMQGEHAAESIVKALGQVSMNGHWDCVVIIRGGGATSDLQCFEDYNLANNIAQFDIPVIIGIGHERDITLLDYVANMRVKTPTAAAEFLISLGENELGKIDALAQKIYNMVSEIIAGNKEQLSYYQGVLPIAPHNAIQRATLRLNRAATLLSGISNTRISPARSRLDVIASNIDSLARMTVRRNRESLEATEKLLAVLSPQSVLNRGYSITRVNGSILTDVSAIAPGTMIETTLATGTITSTAN